MVKMLHTVGLTDTEARIVSDWWLADLELDEAMSRMMQMAAKNNWPINILSEKAIAIRTRYMELDMISIQQDLAERFGFDRDENED